jgi:hypothetical protein
MLYLCLTALAVLQENIAVMELSATCSICSCVLAYLALGSKLNDFLLAKMAALA